MHHTWLINYSKQYHPHSSRPQWPESHSIWIHNRADLVFLQFSKVRSESAPVFSVNPGPKINCSCGWDCGQEGPLWMPSHVSESNLWACNNLSHLITLQAYSSPWGFHLKTVQGVVRNALCCNLVWSPWDANTSFPPVAIKGTLLTLKMIV